MHTHNEAPWMCPGCGYMINAASPTERGHAKPPKGGDICMCLNCGKLFERAGPKWHPMTDAQFDALRPDQQQDLKRMVALRSRAIPVDLAKRGGKA